MKTYFVTSDIHSFYNLFHKALIEKGFDINNKDHILIICGDCFDRGDESLNLLNFIYELYKQNRLIYIKGNHEDLLEECLNQLELKVNISSYHIYNKTIDTIAQITEVNKYDLICGVYNYKKDIQSKFKKYFEIPKLNYYRLNNYLFVHGWIPDNLYIISDLDSEELDWYNARWTNGILAWKERKYFNGITIVCGHWHCSYGNFNYHNKGSSDIGPDADFNPFIDDGIIALDACTAYSKKCNVIEIKVL